MGKTNFKSVARSNRRKDSRSWNKHEKSLSGEQIYNLMKSLSPELNELEINLFANITAVYFEQNNFTLSDHQMAFITGASVEDIKIAVNHLIELEYFKIVPSAKNFGYLRYLEPDIATNCLLMKVRDFYRPFKQEI